MARRSHNSKPLFSIVIPTLNEEKYLPNLLSCLEKQTYDNFEVIHVDGNSADKTVENAESFSNKLIISSILVNKRNVAFQRNTGSAQAKGTWVLFTDADVTFPSDFLDGLRSQIAKHPNCDIFTGLADVNSFDSKDQPVIHVVNLVIEILSYIKPIAQGTLLGVRTEIAQAIPFNEQLPVAEDYALVESIIAAGHTFCCFKEPRYEYSMRRVHKEGMLKTLWTTVEHHFKFFFNKNALSTLDNYPMLGGSYYEKLEKQRDKRELTQLIIAFKEAVKKLPSDVRSKLLEK